MPVASQSQARNGELRRLRLPLYHALQLFLSSSVLDEGLYLVHKKTTAMLSTRMRVASISFSVSLLIVHGYII